MARNRKFNNQRDLFYIITNGEKSEKNYFNLLKSYKSLYDVKVIFNNSSPLDLIKIAKEYVNEANQVWCVFDIDNTYSEKQLLPALQLAKKNKIKIA